jgi:hypothetical protein
MAASMAMGLAVVVLIVRLVQKGRLDIAYCWVWLGVGAGMLLVVLRFQWLVWLSGLIGAKVPTNTLFLLGMLVILLMCLQFSIVTSSHRREIRKLTQQLAILTEERAARGAGTER